MSREQILRQHYKKVIYSQSHIELLEKKRAQALNLLRLFRKNNLNPYLYGSVARGDIHLDSDIDIAFLYRVPIFKIEYILQRNKIQTYNRELIMATPADSIKLYIYLSELKCITLPLTKLNRSSQLFYDFGGKIDYNQLKERVRIPGIDKRLVLIKPTEKGHEEFSIINQESIAAKTVGVPIDIINERKRVLLRREKHGRTGVFLKKELNLNETVQGALKRLAKNNPIIRKKLFL
ncbi:MAG: DNA polymerase subunit beta [Promethearchaeota archaeon]|nr:MAG: DNA polymerase subunit beta [Candidatus Lokiarchaeota archaeon]